jgi:DNA-binding LytR/AlgR family response regulator
MARMNDRDRHLNDGPTQVLAMEDDPTAEVPVSRQYAPRLRKLLGM